MRCPSLQLPDLQDPGETDGVEYFFRTKEQFEKMIAQMMN